MAEKRVTLADVAARAGLSVSAASLVLNDRPGIRISPAARERVREAARELGYRPNLAARTLLTSRSATIGLISDSVTTRPWASALILGALREAHSRDHILHIAETGTDIATAAEALDSFLDRSVDGIIFAASRARELELPDRSIPVPFVMLNATSAAGDASVLPDEFEAGRAIAGVLAAAGIKERIVVLGRDIGAPPDWVDTLTVRRRTAGIAQTVKEHDMHLAAQLPLSAWEPEPGYEAIADLVDSGETFDAIIAMNDRLAFGAYQAMLERGLRVGQDVSVVSFDDDEFAHFVRPGLTTAALPYETMGRLAAELILTGATQPQQHLIPMPIMYRGSVR
ncbi:LacI family DNA-binding transcriptional regulator [Demequina sp.]|uniref:LacI family DNA-binding transcriptional regulator n=1 Tax=Demequina sp. TaxID=2050685 RepID=UPI0025C64B10|nr:LacI family DNA-binding transcriptional regulator [Demequina sp.]